MSKKARNIIILTVAVLLLGGLTALLLLTAPKEEADTETEDEPAQLLYEYEADDVMSVDVENSLGGFRIVRTRTEEWTIDGEEYSDLPKNDTIINTIPNNLCAPEIISTVEENAADMELYGLGESAVKVSVTFDDGEVKRLRIGDISPKSAQSYICFEGESTVYTVSTSSVDALRQDAFSCLSRVVLTEPAEDEYPTIERVTVSRTDLDYDIVLVHDERTEDGEYITGSTAAHVMIEPIDAQLNLENSVDITYGIFGLYGDSIAAIHPTEEELSEYGLAEPFCTVVTETDEGDYTLIIGNEAFDEDGNSIGYYGCFEGIDMVYVFSADSVKWVDVMPLDMTLTLIFSIYIYYVDNIELTIGDTTNLFTVTGDDNNTLEVTLDGEKIDNEIFKSFYQFLLRAAAEELWLEEPEGEPDAVLQVNCRDGESELLEFYRVSDRRVVIKHNGRPAYSMRTAYLTTLIENAERIRNGEEPVMNW